MIAIDIGGFLEAIIQFKIFSINWFQIEVLFDVFKTSKHDTKLNNLWDSDAWKQGCLFWRRCADEENETAR